MPPSKTTKKSAWSPRTLSVVGVLALSLLVVIPVGAAFLTFVTYYQDGGTGGNFLDNIINIVVSPDGKHVYAAAVADDAITAFSRDSASGELTVIESYVDGAGVVDGLNGVIDVAISPDGAHVYTVSLIDDALAVFSRDSATGELTFVEVHTDSDAGINGLDTAYAVTLSPDGKHVYVTSVNDASVALFSRDSGTGALTFVAAYVDFGTLIGASDVAVSPDGKHVYATSESSRLNVYTRNSGSGELTFVTSYRDGVGGVDGLNNAETIAISPDGNFVYIAALLDDSVAFFQRDSSTGELSYIDLVRDGVNGVDNLDQAHGLVITSSGEYLFVTAWNDNALSVFARDSVSGELSLVEDFVDGVDGVDGLRSAAWLALSPDDESLYVAGHLDDAIALFSSPDLVGTTSTANTNSASKDIAATGTTTLQLGDIVVSVPSSAVAGLGSCRVGIEDLGSSGQFGFTLDDTVWDVDIVCDGVNQHIFFAPIRVCIQADGSTAGKQVFHRDDGGGSFIAMTLVDGPADYVCAETRVLSLFTLGSVSLPATGFAPGVAVDLDPEVAYAATGLQLSIPELGLTTDIVGVPQSMNGWDVRWLGNQAGFLQGTAFPTFAGNTVITAHVWGADNQPGPFYGLESLGYGDRFTISAWGQSYTYEVRGNEVYRPNALSPLEHSDYDWVTLITCEGFDEASGSYLFRRVVRAVLVSVE